MCEEREIKNKQQRDFISLCLLFNTYACCVCVYLIMNVRFDNFINLKLELFRNENVWNVSYIVTPSYSFY